MRAAAFDAPKVLKEEGSRDFLDRQAADPGEKVLLHALDPALPVLLAPSAVFDRMHFTRNRLERCLGGNAPRELVKASPLHRVDPGPVFQNQRLDPSGETSR